MTLNLECVIRNLPISKKFLIAKSMVIHDMMKSLQTKVKK